MRQLLSTLALASLLCSIGFVATVRADEATEKGRAIFKQNENAVITVEVVVKVSDGSKSRESKLDLTGTVIDPVGLTVLSLSSADRGELERRVFGKSSYDYEVTDVKFLLNDGTELPAEIVLRDKDLDLAFCRPKVKPASPMPAVDAKNFSTADVLDELVSLNRLKQAAGRAHSASVERVSAVIRKPRTFYIPDSGLTETSLGSPAFTLDGKFLGLFVMRAVSAAGQNSASGSVTSIILPAEDIVKAAEQAPEVKPEDASAATTSTNTVAAPSSTNSTVTSPAKP